MKRLIATFAALVGILSNVYGMGPSRENRATRMSVVEFWKNETHGDGLNLRIAHGVNSWPALVDQLHEPFLNKSLMIEGDVFMHQHRRPRHKQAIPIMRAPPRVADRITFKEWLREVGSLKKAIKINFRSTEVVRPVLQTLYAAQDELKSPVILHANVFRSPRSIENEVDPSVFVEKTQSLFPDATLSLGWTRNNVSDLSDKYKKMSWREVFEILDYVVTLDQPVMLSIRLSIAANSRDELLWLLGMEKSVSLLIWSDEEDHVDDWTRVADIRRAATRNRVLYDLLPEHKQKLQAYESEPLAMAPTFDISAWRALDFQSAGTMLSRVVKSSGGPAFLGWPSGQLLSLTQPPRFPETQTVDGRVHFMPKRVHRDLSLSEDSGVSIMLLDKLVDAEHPETAKGVQVFIGYDGRMWIENKGKRLEGYEVKSMGRLPKSHCYAFRVVDRGWRVHAAMWPEHCHGHRHKRHGDEEKIEPLILDLDTPFQSTRNLRHVVVSKSGDGAIDFLMPALRHSGSAGILSSLVVLLSLFSLFFQRL